MILLPGVKLQPYQVRMLEFFQSIPEGYRPELHRGGRRQTWIARAPGKPTLIRRDGEWAPIDAPAHRITRQG